jgi:hypothetical protein
MLSASSFAYKFSRESGANIIIQVEHFVRNWNRLSNLNWFRASATGEMRRLDIVRFHGRVVKELGWAHILVQWAAKLDGFAVWLALALVGTPTMSN